jgi:uncharacterized protein (DUF849 family)
MTSRKVIITCAVTGAAPLNPRYPKELNYPVTPQQIADAAIDAAMAGAAIVHLHVRDPKTGESSRDPELFCEVTRLVRASGIDVLVNLTCGIGGMLFLDPDNEPLPAPGSDIIPAAERVRHIEMARPDICSLDITTANQTEDGRDYVYLNTVPTIRRMAESFQLFGVKPELEMFSCGDAMLGRKLIEDGLVDAPPMMQFVLGVEWGAPATPETMMYLRGLLPPEAVWTAFGISRMQMPMAAQSVLLGGHVRVGLEDNLYLSRGEFATNRQLVERAVTIIQSLGHSVATPDDARAILQLPARPRG